MIRWPALCPNRRCRVSLSGHVASEPMWSSGTTRTPLNCNQATTEQTASTWGERVTPGAPVVAAAARFPHFRSLISACYHISVAVYPSRQDWWSRWKALISPRCIQTIPLAFRLPYLLRSPSNNRAPPYLISLSGFRIWWVSVDIRARSRFRNGVGTGRAIKWL